MLLVLHKMGKLKITEFYCLKKYRRIWLGLQMCLNLWGWGVHFLPVPF